MNAQLLIDGVVRQTTVLIAQLATTGGIRAPIANLANQVFLDLTRELDAQGVSRKVSADMFGMALRAYLRKIQRLSESSTDHGRSLWEAVYEFLRGKGFISRSEVVERFARDDETQVRAVLHDLVETGLVLQTGTGSDGVLRASTDDELGQMRRMKGSQVDQLVWAFVFHQGPVGRSELGQIEALLPDELDAALGRLLAEGRIVREVHLDEARYMANRLVVPLGAELGWEAAVLDHFHAMVVTICRKLATATKSAADDSTGGSTYTYEVWPGHPLEREVLDVLATFRRAQSTLRARVRAHNESVRETPEDAYRVVVYGGQHSDQEEETSP